MGHVNLQSLKRMVTNGKLLNIDNLTEKPMFCKPCALGKMKRLSLKQKITTCAKCLFKLVHSDVGGPITPISRKGYCYWITFTDDHNHFPWVYFMKHKSEAHTIYYQWKSDIYAIFQCKIEQLNLPENLISWLHMDRAGEYMGAKFKAELHADSAIHESSAPYTQE
jgi:hypothetical protein